MFLKLCSHYIHSERLVLESALDRLREHASRMLFFQFNLDYLDNIVTRYMAQVCGYLALSIPFMSARYAADNHTTRLEVMLQGKSKKTRPKTFLL